jgi:hypothetical protein
VIQQRNNTRLLLPRVEAIDFVDNGQTGSQQVSDCSHDIRIVHVFTNVVILVDEKDAGMGSSLCLPAFV